ncbi:MAG TPA: diaminopimelate epimerase [Caulobacteraceae bacterium]|jgi:diaminopimelate epimerase|nr:diaminopimelate epimerase [Caulobacteraceae bacterium]
MTLPFVKMNGLGNDFVVVIAEDRPFAPSPDQVRAIADRASGVGCDQLIAVARSDRAAVNMRIWNADGGEVGACGNASRCVAWLAMESMGLDRVRLETPKGLLDAWRVGERIVTVDMGPPRFEWSEIPLSRRVDTRQLPIEVTLDLRNPGAVSMGNPHVVFFVMDLDRIAIDEVGPMMERHPLFPQRTNVGFAEIREHDRIRLKVWERGAGLTQACGTGACAALVAAHRRGLVDRAAMVELDGGELEIDWSEVDDHVRMTGPVSIEFTGLLDCVETPA